MNNLFRASFFFLEPSFIQLRLLDMILKSWQPSFFMDEQ